MPVIRSVVSKMFGRLPFSEINPDEAVALGAAIQVALKERNQALSEVVLTDVNPYTLGINVSKRVGKEGHRESGYYYPIIERNMPIPISRVEDFYTIEDNQTKICVKIYQGESRRVENNIYLGELEVDVPPKPEGEESILVRFTYDINGILEVEVTTVSTNEKKRIVITQNPGKMTDEEIEKRLKELNDLKIHPRDRVANRLLLARGERLYEELLGEKRGEVEYLMLQFERVLAEQDQRKADKAAAELKKQLDRLERWRDF
ncbi:Chaperone protein HscC [compost metagenome]